MWRIVLALLLAGPATAVEVPLPPERPAAAETSPAGDPRPMATAAPDLSRLPVARHLDDPPDEPMAEAALAPLPPVKPLTPATGPVLALRSTPEQRRGDERPICGDPRLAGRLKPTVTGRRPGCLITDPVEVTAIAGIRLSMPATLACPAARTFANWITGVADPAARDLLGAPIKRVWVMGSFACRTRNSLRGTRLSEHSVGRAVDVGGFTLGDGRKIRVKSDWGKGRPGAFLRHVWKRACGMFKTVLGPDGDRFHRDHLHVDVALRRSAFCR